VQCVEATERLLAKDSGYDPELEQHIASCARCTHTASGLERVDGVLRSSLVVTPPLDLQHQLLEIAFAAAKPQPKAWWARVPDLVGQLNLADLLAQRPQMVAAQGLAAVMVALASWTVFSWLSAFQPVLGDVGYAMELVAASPAAVYLSGIQFDFQSLTMWSLVGLFGWLISENGLIGRTIGSRRSQLP
jgi:hypothetical protein